MLFNEVNEFNFLVRNIGDVGTYITGTDITAHATAHTKGAAVTLLAGASVTEDIFGVYLQFGNAIGAGTQREFLIDLLLDPAGGTSWSNFIDNLFIANAESAFMGGTNFYFPIFIKAGTSIGAQAQCNTGSAVTKCVVSLLGKPSHPHLVNVGSKVETIGANTSLSRGTAVSAPGGASTFGAYTSLGTTGQDNWFWQAGVGLGDASLGSSSFLYQFELTAGDASNKRLCVGDRSYTADASERAGASNWAGVGLPIRKVPAGQTVYARVTGGSETNPSAVAYGVR